LQVGGDLSPEPDHQQHHWHRGSTILTASCKLPSCT
jgi:hypothetical protein